MGAWVDPTLCVGCGECVRICPGDLLRMDVEGKAVNCHPQECWHCMACAKVCRQRAIVLNLPFSIANRGARLYSDADEDQIRWTCIDPDGRKRLEFILPKRTPKEAVP